MLQSGSGTPLHLSLRNAHGLQMLRKLWWLLSAVATAAAA
jgi:hypothetical protein